MPFFVFISFVGSGHSNFRKKFKIDSKNIVALTTQAAVVVQYFIMPNTHKIIHQFDYQPPPRGTLYSVLIFLYKFNHN